MTTNEFIRELHDTKKKIIVLENGLTSISDILAKAAYKIEEIHRLIDNSTIDHYVDALDFYADRCQKLEEDFTELVMKSENTCDYCKHSVECKGKDCPKYIEGRGCTDENGKYYDWKWSCEDFNWGECPLLENTPCNGCIDGGNKGFEWRGN